MGVPGLAARAWHGTVNLGTDPDSQTDLAKAVRITNRFSMICAALCLMSVPFDMATAGVRAGYVDLGLAGLFLFILWLNHRGLVGASRIAFLFLAALILLANMMSYGPEAGLQFFCFILVCLPAIILMESEWPWILLFGTLSALILVGTEARWMARWLPSDHAPGGIEAMRWFAIGVTLLELFVGAFYLQRENRRAMAKVRAQQAALVSAEKMSSLGRMAGGVAHEINTPLATLMTWSGQLSEIVKEGPLDQEWVVSMADTVDQTVKKISHIVKSLQMVAREVTRDAPEPVSVALLLHEAVSLCGESFATRGVFVEIEPFPAAPQGLCRRTEVIQILLGLMNNAFDAVVRAPEKRIWLSARDAGEFWALEVTDSGPGIPSQVRGKIFDPFFTTKPVGEGTGLGLSVARSLAERQGKGASLWFDESSPKTRFVLWLPKA